jgi:hypothetical protein
MSPVSRKKQNKTKQIERKPKRKRKETGRTDGRPRMRLELMNDEEIGETLKTSQERVFFQRLAKFQM